MIFDAFRMKLIMFSVFGNNIWSFCLEKLNHAFNFHTNFWNITKY